LSGKIGERGFVARLRATRPPVVETETGKSAKPDPAGTPLAPRIEPSRNDVALLESALVPKKITAAYGEYLIPSLGDIAALVEKSRRLEPHFAAQYSRAIGGFYGTLGKLLAATPATSRAEVAASCIRGMKELVATMKRGEHLVPALFAMIGQLDSGARLLAQDRLSATPAELGKLASDAVDRVRAFNTYLDGCEGIGAALSVLPNILEQMDRSAPKLKLAERTKLLDEAMTFFVDTSPRAGLNQTIAGNIRDSLARALVATPGDPLKALAAAKKELRAAQTESRDRVYKTFDDSIPEDWQRGTPRFEAFWSLRVAMFDILKANPVGPEQLYEHLETIYKQAVAAREAPMYELDVQAVAHIMARVGNTPLATPMCEFFANASNLFAEHPAKSERLLAAAGERDLGELAKSLMVARAYFYDSGSIRKLQGLNSSIELLDLLDPVTAMKTVFATSSNFYNARSVSDLLETVAEAAQNLEVDQPLDFLTKLGARFNTFDEDVGDWPPGLHIANATQLARAVALALPKEPNDWSHRRDLSAFLQEVAGKLPGYPLEELIQGDLVDRPGLLKLADPDQKFKRSPREALGDLLSVVWKKSGGKHAPVREPARVAMAIAEKVGHMDGDPAIPLARIKKDFEAAISGKNARPSAGATGSMVSVRASQVANFEAFLKANPELPIELAPTAAIHLSSGQLAWVKERLASALKSRDSMRTLRDFVFACVDAGRLDLIDVMRSPGVPAKAISHSVIHIAGAYRLAGAEHVPFELVAATLARREDPVAILDRAKQQAAVASLKMPELDGAKVTDAGLQTLMDNAGPVGGLLSHFGPDYHGELSVARGFRDNDLDYQAIRAPFVAALVDVAEGTWPKVKYESEIGRRMLRELSEDQIAIWRSQTVTAAQNAGTPEEIERQAQALALLRGLEKVIPEHVSLGGELAFDETSLGSLRKERDELLTQLRGAEKGSREHRSFSGQIGPLNDRIAVIELQLALTEKFSAEAIDPAQLLVELRPLLGRASQAASKLGPRVITNALAEVIDASSSIKMDSRDGKHAIDEDSLNALIGSHKSGCLNPTDDHYGFRRFGLAQALVDANTKMLRVYDDSGKMVYRGFLRILRAESDEYTGPMLWIENPHNDGGGGDAEARLLFKNAVNKAIAMGIPVMSSYGSSWLGQVASEMNLRQNSSFSAKVCVEAGNTAVLHSDALSNGTGRIDKNAGPDGYWRINQYAAIVYPEKLAAPEITEDAVHAEQTAELKAEPQLEEEPTAEVPVLAPTKQARMKWFTDMIARLWKGND
jgi:hypothetical protein